MKKITIKVSGNEVMSINDSDLYHCYNDLRKTASERKNDQYQGIDMSGNQNATRIRVGAGDKDEAVAADKAIADAFSNRFYIPLDFELLESNMPIRAQWAAGSSMNSLSTTTAVWSRPQVQQGLLPTPHGSENISLESDMVTQPDLARMIASQYRGRLSILYDRVLRYKKISKDFNLNVSTRSMKA